MGSSGIGPFSTAIYVAAVVALVVSLSLEIFPCACVSVCLCARVSGTPVCLSLTAVEQLNYLHVCPSLSSLWSVPSLEPSKMTSSAMSFPGHSC